MSHSINNSVLTSTNPCINKATHVLLMHGFAVLQISIPGSSQKLTSSSVLCTLAMTLVFALEAAFSKRSQITCFSVPLYVHEKKNFLKQFLQSFRAKRMFYAIIAIKHAFLIYYAPPPESGGVLCYTLRNFECPSVRPSVPTSVYICG